MELYHYGVKGMRWGVRRYQNKDGSLTNAGRKHRSNDRGEQKKTYVAKNGDIRKKFDLDNDYENQWGNVASLVNEKSMDWYSGKGVSKSAKAIIRQYNKGRDKISKKYQYDSGRYYDALDRFKKKIYPKIAGVVLRDLGYEDTKQAREWMLKHQTIMWG